MTALLLAATSDGRWNNHLGVAKHLVPIHGEPLIHRTQRQLLDRGVADVCVVTTEDKAADYILPQARWELPKPSPRDWVQEWDGSRHLWSITGKTTILYGDCYFSDALMDAIASDAGQTWHAWARWDPSAKTGKPWGEMFGWTFSPEHHDILDQARAEVIAAVSAGRYGRALGWEVYRLAVGFRIDQHQKDAVHAVDWSDESDDFDAPRDWERWRERNPGLA